MRGAANLFVAASDESWLLYDAGLTRCSATLVSSLYIFRVDVLFNGRVGIFVGLSRVEFGNRWDCL